MIRFNRVLGVLGAALIGVGCTGSIDGMNATGAGPGPGSGPKGPPSVGTPDDPTPPTNVPPKTDDQTPKDPTAGSLDDSAAKPGAAPLRRLTILEFKNTIRDLLGIDVAQVPTEGLPQDLESAASGFSTGANFSTGDDARGFMKIADALGTIAASKLSTLLPCAASADESCAQQFITQFGLRAFRRPLSGAESAKLLKLYQDQRDASIGGMNFQESIAALVSAMLQTPYFLYHWELGPNKPTMDGALVRYNPYEMASRLSYMIWASAPDADLLQEAVNGGLTSPAQIEKAARRLLADNKAKDAVRDFHYQWLEIFGLKDLDKDPVYTNYTPEVAQSMADETAAFVNNIFFGPNATGSLTTLLTSNKSFIDGKLGKVYGVSSATGNDLKEVALDPTQRAGILTQGSFLAMKADPDLTVPPRRGNSVLGRVLCMDFRPPDNVMIPPPAEPNPNQTTRQRFEVHGTAPCATACHTLIDPVGFAFENYDAIGAWRTQENKPNDVDASGKVEIGKDTLTFKNAVDLLGQLAKRPEVQSCMATQWLRYGLRRHDDVGDAPSLTALNTTFAKAGYDMRELMVAVTKTRAFTHRTLSVGEAQ
jgi:hypothetical protein